MFKMDYNFANCLLFASFAPKCDFSSVNNTSSANAKRKEAEFILLMAMNMHDKNYRTC